MLKAEPNFFLLLSWSDNNIRVIPALYNDFWVAFHSFQWFDMIVEIMCSLEVWSNHSLNHLCVLE